MLGKASGSGLWLAHLALHALLRILEQALVVEVLRLADLLPEHLAAEHVEGEGVGVAQDAARHMQLLLTLRTGQGKAYILVGQVTQERANAVIPSSMYIPSDDPWFELEIY